MKKVISSILIIIIILLLWQYSGSTDNNVRMLISTPSLCCEYFFENTNNLMSATFITLLESFLGLLIATLIAFSIMVLCFRFKYFYNVILPFLLSSQVIPLITLAPFFILWLGIGISSKIALSVVISFYPIFLNFATGYNSIPKNIFDLLDIYNANMTTRIIKVYFPLSLPNIFTGLKLAATLSIVGSIIAEFSGAQIGLGKNLLMSAIRIEPELMVLSVFLSALLGGILFGIIFLLEKFFGKWYVNDKQIQ